MSGFEVQIGQPRNATKAAGSWLGASHAVCGVQRSGSATLVLVAAGGRQNGCSQWVDRPFGIREDDDRAAVLGMLPAGAQVTGSIRVAAARALGAAPAP